MFYFRRLTRQYYITILIVKRARSIFFREMGYIAIVLRILLGLLPLHFILLCTISTKPFYRSGSPPPSPCRFPVLKILKTLEFKGRIATTASVNKHIHEPWI